MSKKKKTEKVNPNRIPATQADVDKALEKGHDEGLELSMAIMLTVLCDKEGYDADSLKRVWDEVNYLSDSVRRKYVKVGKLIETLANDYGIYITDIAKKGESDDKL